MLDTTATLTLCILFIALVASCTCPLLLQARFSIRTFFSFTTTERQGTFSRKTILSYLTLNRDALNAKEKYIYKFGCFEISVCWDFMFERYGTGRL